MKFSSAVSLGVCGTLLFASVAAAQRPAPSTPDTPADDTVAVAIALQAGGGSIRFSGQATCTYEPKGYIYTVPAQQWHVAQSDPTRNVSLTLWRQADGAGDMFTLYLKSGSKAYKASTVKTKDGGSPEGSGEVTFAKAGAGGTFTVNATTANGTKVSGTVSCGGFRAAFAEGGH